VILVIYRLMRRQKRGNDEKLIKRHLLGKRAGG